MWNPVSLCLFDLRGSVMLDLLWASPIYFCVTNLIALYLRWTGLHFEEIWRRQTHTLCQQLLPADVCPDSRCHCIHDTSRGTVHWGRLLCVSWVHTILCVVLMITWHPGAHKFSNTSLAIFIPLEAFSKRIALVSTWALHLVLHVCALCCIYSCLLRYNKSQTGH